MPQVRSESWGAGSLPNPLSPASDGPFSGPCASRACGHCRLPCLADGEAYSEIAHLFQRFDGGNCMPILDAGDIAPEQARALLNVTLRKILFFAECAKSVAYNHGGSISLNYLQSKYGAPRPELVSCCGFRSSLRREMPVLRRRSVCERRNAASDQFSYCNRKYLSLLFVRCCSSVKRREFGQE